MEKVKKKKEILNLKVFFRALSVRTLFSFYVRIVV